MGKDLSDEQVSAMKEAFTLFDTNDDCKIAQSKLGILMHYLSRNPMQAQLKPIITEKKLTSPFDFNRFVDLMLKHLKPEPFDHQLRDAFKVIGEKLEPTEFDKWIREIDVGSDGKIKYEDFIVKGETLDAGGKKKEGSESQSPQFMAD